MCLDDLYHTHIEPIDYCADCLTSQSDWKLCIWSDLLDSSPMHWNISSSWGTNVTWWLSLQFSIWLNLVPFSLDQHLEITRTLMSHAKFVSPEKDDTFNDFNDDNDCFDNIWNANGCVFSASKLNQISDWPVSAYFNTAWSIFWLVGISINNWKQVILKLKYFKICFLLALSN